MDLGGKRPNWGCSESPLIDGDKVVVTPGGSDGAIVALDKQTGALIWRSKDFTDPPHYSSVIMAEIGGVRQYFQLTAESVVGVAAADGKLLWQAVRKGKTAVTRKHGLTRSLLTASSTSEMAIRCSATT